jgi:hypothetical protein
MDISKDQLRRDRRAAAAAQAAAMPRFRQLLSRTLDGSAGLPDRDRADLASGGVSRRRFLAVGGFSVATAAVLAACGPEEVDQIPQGGQLPSSTALPTYPVSDLTLVRTASSLEYNLIDTYGALVSLDTVSAEARELMTFFADQHREHAAVFEEAAVELGGQPFQRANPRVYENVIEPTLQVLANGGNAAQDVYRFAHALETVAGATYQQVVPAFTVPALRSAAMSVGGVEAIHSALWVTYIDEGLVSPVTAAAAEGGTTTAPASPSKLPVYMVPSAFGQVNPVEVQLGEAIDTIDLPGPNSFMYPELGE